MVEQITSLTSKKQRLPIDVLLDEDLFVQEELDHEHELEITLEPTKLRVGEQTKISERLASYKEDWCNWIEEWLHINCQSWDDDLMPDDWKPSDGYPIWTKQKEIIHAVQMHKRVAVKSSHDIGKTFVAAIIAMCILYVEHGLGLTTAPTFRQVKRLLWAEVHKLYNYAESINKKRGKTLGGQLNRTSLELDTGKWYMEGFSTDKDYNFQGFHESTFFLIVDEAGQVDRETYDAFDSVLTNENVYVLLIGNPIDPHNEFKNCFKSGSGFYQMSIDSWMTPNVKHQRNMYPMLVDKDWPAMMLKKWKDEDHPFYRGKVRAEFPLEGEDQLITWDLIQQALDRELPVESPIVSLGLDVARQGSDTTVYGARQRNGRYRIYRTTEQERETETAGRFKLDLDGKSDILKEAVGVQVKQGEVCGNIDDIGVGGGVVDILFEEDYPINDQRVSEAPDDSFDEEESKMFLNKRAVFYWKLRQAFVDGDVDIDDEELALELHAIQKEYTSGGKIKMMSKDKIKKLIGRSPDKSDAMMLAWSEEESDSTRDLVRHV